MVSGDTTFEADETVNLTLSAPAGGAGLGTPNPATLTIINDDHSPVANDVSDSTGQNTLKTITMSSTDADGDAQIFSIVDSPQHGTLGSISAPVCSSGSCTATVDYTPRLATSVLTVSPTRPMTARTTATRRQYRLR
jgi:hypothetical protein